MALLQQYECIQVAKAHLSWLLEVRNPEAIVFVDPYYLVLLNGILRDQSLLQKVRKGATYTGSNSYDEVSLAKLRTYSTSLLISTTN